MADTQQRIVRYQVNGTTFDIDDKCYTLQHAIGQGAYGVVCSGNDVRNQTKVAIKKVTNAFVDVDTRRILREIKLLSHFSHDNIIGIRDILKPPSKAQFTDIYIVTDLMDTDLNQIIRSGQPLTDQHIQYFIYQVLRGLKCIHSANVLHRDLKPSNILLNSNCELKICDFGLARANMLSDMTDYVATRWYRSPELLMRWKRYDKAIDIWSVGCIWCELLGGKAIFPGKDYMHQLELILSIVGSPRSQDIPYASECAREWVLNKPFYPPRSFDDLYPNANRLALDLIKKMLNFNPDNRPTVEQCLAHPYFAQLHDEADEPTAALFDYSFENRAKTRADIKEMIYAEMLRFHPEAVGEHNDQFISTPQESQSLSEESDEDEEPGSEISPNNEHNMSD